jgi:hypothetical protein
MNNLRPMTKWEAERWADLFARMYANGITSAFKKP